MGTSFDELQARRKPREASVDLPLNESLLDEIADLERQVDEAKHLDEAENEPPRAPRLQKALDDLVAAASDEVETFTFRELSRPVYRDLIVEHPDPAGALRWNEDTFIPALLAACCVSHDYTVEQWAELWMEWPGWMGYPLSNAALEVCDVPSKVPFGLRRSGATDS